MAGVQRGGREGGGNLNSSAKCEESVKCQRLYFALSSHFALEFNFPLPPHCTPAMQASLEGIYCISIPTMGYIPCEQNV